MHTANPVESTNPKDKIGRTKPPLDLIPPAAEILESMVFELGRAKYGKFNWRDHSVAAGVYIGAAKRHIAQWLDRDDIDPESGVSHLAHARACLGIILDAEANGSLVDDRPTAGAASVLIKKLTKSNVEPTVAEQHSLAKYNGIWQPDSWPKESYVTILDGRAARVGSTTAVYPVTDTEIDGIDSGRWKRRVVAEPTRAEPWYEPAFVRSFLISELGCPENVAHQIVGGITFAKSADKRNATARFAYVAGPMRGRENFNFPAFDAARDRLVKEGWNIISPADIDRIASNGVVPTPEEAERMQATYFFRDMMTLYFLKRQGNPRNKVHLLEGWEASKGAVGEFFAARWLGLGFSTADGDCTGNELMINGFARKNLGMA